MPRPKRARPTHSTGAPAGAPTSSDNEQHTVAKRRTSGRATRSSGPGPVSLEQKTALSATRGRGRERVVVQVTAEEDITTLSTSDAAVIQNDNGNDDSESPVELGRREMATPTHRRDTTGLDLADDDVFGDLDDSFGDGDVPRAPMSADTTVMSVGSVRPRSRQSSFIGRNDPPIRPSSRRGSTPGAGSTFNIGMFRRRAREPSILGTTRKPRPEPASSAVHGDSDDDAESDRGNDNAEQDEDDEEVFAPDAESTPLHQRKGRGRKSAVQAPAQAETQTQSDEEEEEEEEEEAAAGSKPASGSRKRKSGEMSASAELGESETEESERPEKAARTGHDPIYDLPVSDSDSDLSSLSSSPQPPPSHAFMERPRTPIDLEAMAAPPASSDSEDAATVWPDIHTLAKRRRRPSVTTPHRGGDVHSDMSSPPSLTHSPNYNEHRSTRARGRAATRRQPSPKVTTADLTDLLPKRRHKRIPRSPGADSDDEDNELDASGLAQDEDELSYLDTRAARRRRNASRQPNNRSTSSRPASRGGRLNNSALKQKQTSATAATGASSSSRGKSRNSRTYSRRSSDKENESAGSEGDDEDHTAFEPLPDDPFHHGDDEGHKAQLAAQMKEVVKKFNEVDQWELEFEEVTESSSPQDGR